MKQSLLFPMCSVLAFSLNACSQTQDEFIGLKGPYLGQQPPSMEPKIFALDVVSTDKNEVNSVFTPDGKEFYYSFFSPQRGYTIMVMKENEQGWSKPGIACFSGEFSEVDMFITHDGTRLFYISKRPIERDQPPPRGYQIWVVERLNGEWTNATHLGPEINFGSRQLYPSVANSGALYFNSDKNGFGKGDFFRSEYIDGKYANPENIGNSINTEYDETDPLIAPDESYMIFTSVSRPDGYGSGDLYISFRNTDGSWQEAKNMGQTINTSSSEFAPLLSPDARYLFFTSGRRGNDDIYWVDAKIIQSYK